MTTTTTSAYSELPPIPVDYVVGHAKALNKSPRQPFVDLIKQWAEHEGMVDAGNEALRQLRGTPVITPSHMPREINSGYRGEKAAQLIEIMGKISEEVASNPQWNWALVMRVMVDEGILWYKTTTNRFDTIICGMVPGKGHDTVRKNGDYESIMEDLTSSYHSWTELSHVNPTEANNREVCMQIVELFKPILAKK
jgi:hypothetical protein